MRKISLRRALLKDNFRSFFLMVTLQILCDTAFSYSYSFTSCLHVRGFFFLFTRKKKRFFRTFLQESYKLRGMGRMIACSGRKSIIGSFKIWIPFANCFITFKICFFFSLHVLDYTGTSISRVGRKITSRKWYGLREEYLFLALAFPTLHPVGSFVVLPMLRSLALWTMASVWRGVHLDNRDGAIFHHWNHVMLCHAGVTFLQIADVTLHIDAMALFCSLLSHQIITLLLDAQATFV